ncbi:MAG: biopolymer transporter ExbD [Ignavibacteria bacterium]|nr:biopolymer transporter ExbD [Ignavibacteria bacterium]
MSAVKKRRRPAQQIDMTPYVDVIMLILTFFILTAQFKAELAEDIQVKLPNSGNDTTKLPERNVMTLVINRFGDIFADVDNIKVREDVLGDPIGLAAYHPDSTTQPGWNNPANLNDKGQMKRPIIAFKDREKFKKLLIDFRLSSKSNVGKDLRIVVKGDKESDIGVVQDLMDMLKETKNTRFAFVTDLEQDDAKEKK